MATVFLNGRFLGADEAAVSAFDAGLQHGVGVFETMIGGAGAAGAWAHRLDDHIARITGSVRDLGLSESVRGAGLAEAVLETARRAELDRARIRLTVTGGDLNLLRKEAGQAMRPTVMVQVQPVTAYPAEMFERGVAAVIAAYRCNPLDPMAGHKTLSYWVRLRELQSAAASGAGEALVFQVTNHLAGGCVSNAFLVKEGALVTSIARGEEVKRAGAGGEEATEGGGATLPSPVLPGIARKVVIEAAVERGVPVQRRMVTIDDVLGADEVFVTNSSWGVLPVVRVERERIGGGDVGDVTRRMMEAWRSSVEEAGEEPL